MSRVSLFAAMTASCAAMLGCVLDTEPKGTSCTVTGRCNPGFVCVASVCVSSSDVSSNGDAGLGDASIGDAGRPDSGPPGPRGPWTTTQRFGPLEVSETGGYVEVVTSTVPAAPDHWRLIFLSGTLTGTEESEPDVVIRIGAEIIHRFGHYALGEPDETPGAGFLTYHAIPPTSEAQTLAVEMNTTAQVARLNNLEIVLARLPAGADPRSSHEDDASDVEGLDVTLRALELPPTGRWLVLGRMSLSESPGRRAAQGWLEGPSGNRRPLDRYDTTFSAPRDALNPMFTSMVVEGGRTVRLRGHSSGSNEESLQNWLEPTYRIRMPLQIEGSAPPGYALRVTFDHAAQVAAGRSMQDGADVVLIYAPPVGAPERLHRVLDPDSAWNRPDTTLWFRLPTAVDGTSDAFALYMAGPAGPLEDPQQVFSLYDDFSSATLDDSRWSMSGDGIRLESGRMIVDGPAILKTRVGSLPVGVEWAARARLGPDTDGLSWLLAHPDNSAEGVELKGSGGARSAHAGGSQEPVQVAQGADRIYTIASTDGQTFDFWESGRVLATVVRPAPSPSAPWFLGLTNQDGGSAEYDWIRVRPYQSEEPMVTVQGPQGEAGTRGSQFRYRNLVAINLEAFEDDAIGETGETVQTERPFVSVADINRPPSGRERLVLMSVRVSGEHSYRFRRRGIIRVNRRNTFVTSHRINADNSRANGYHHIAGRVFAASATTALNLEVGVDSPDGILVTGADGRIIVLDFPQ